VAVGAFWSHLPWSGDFDPPARPPRHVRLVVRYRKRGSRRLLVYQHRHREGPYFERTVVVVFVGGIFEHAWLVEAAGPDETRSHLAVAG